MSMEAVSEGAAGEEAASWLEVAYLGRRGSLFSLSLKTLLLTLFTFGFYRFWMKTRLRRYYWGATRIDGEPLEYAGTGLEKIIGFLIAVTFLAVYLGIAQVFLSYVGVSVIESGGQAFNLAFLAVVPIYFYALYRARAYVLARTRWRGIRFALKKGAWGYAFRALWHSLLTIVSAGLLYPRQVFHLEKYMTDRTRFGDLRLRQEGRWFMLLGPWLAIWLPVALVGGAIGWGAYAARDMPPEEIAIAGVIDGEMGVILLVAIGVPLLLLALYAILAVFGAVAKRRMAMHKRAGEGVRLVSGIRSGKVFRVYFFGVIGVLVAALVPMALVVGLMVLVFFAPLGADGAALGADMMDPGQISEWQVLAGMLLSAAIYMIFMFTTSVFWHLCVTQPIWRHFATSLRVENADEIAGARQRDRAELKQAEGFVDALDLGAAI